MILRRRLLIAIVCSIFAVSLLAQGIVNPLEHPVSRQIWQIVPAPVSVIKDSVNPAAFVIDAKTKIALAGISKAARPTIDICVEQLRAVTGKQLKLDPAGKPSSANRIVLSLLKKDAVLARDGYRLKITKKNAAVEALSAAGILYGVQSLLQLMADVKPETQYALPGVTVVDSPRFAWRGMHLDVSRHFFPVEFVKKYIDLLVMHKLNVFHWHLTDDQGWRLEIKKYPKLAEISAWRADRESQREWRGRAPQQPGEKATYGGYYTQEQVKEVIAYAKVRQITIVPEIEMPAHALSVLAAYPELSCAGGPFTVSTGAYWPCKDIFCAGNEKTFEFLEDVLSEVIALFPSEYIHVGGDEADKQEWKKCPKCQQRIKDEHLANEAELQSYFIKRIEKFIISKHRRMIGWDEILEGGLAPEATVMSWRGMQGGIDAARQNHDVVMTPTDYCYFDYYQGNPGTEPLSIGGYLPLKKVYEFEPVPSDSLSPEQLHHILGGQANIWAEYIPTPEHCEYMALPRMAALAEAVWSPKSERNWDWFALRIPRLLKYYERRGYNYAQSSLTIGMQTQKDSASGGINIALANELGTGGVTTIRYTVDGAEPTEQSMAGNLVPLEHPMRIRAASFVEGKRMGPVVQRDFPLNKAAFKPVKENPAAPRYYPGGGEYALTNLMTGSTKHQDGTWRGYTQAALEWIVDLGKEMPVSDVAASFLQISANSIYFPVSVEYAVAGDTGAFRSVGSLNNDTPPMKPEAEVKTFAIKFEKSAVRYVRVRAKNLGVNPPEHVRPGERAWVMIDEIVVN